MKFHYIGHACVGVEAEGFVLLLDPWFGFPFYFDRMSPYPPFSRPQEQLLRRVNAVHISHLHGDHLCFKSLATFAKSLPIYISSYTDDYFHKTFTVRGWQKIIVIPDKIGIKVGPFQIYSFRLAVNDDSFDSLLVVEYKGRRFLFNNDCVLSETQYKQMQDQFGSFEGGFLGYTVVSPFPTCYQFPMKDRFLAIEELQNKAIQHIKTLHGFFQFQWIVPYASGMRFLTSGFLQHNEMFVDPTRLQREISAPVFILEPGQVWTPGESTQAKFKYSGQEVEDWLKKNQRLLPPLALIPLLKDEEYIQFFKKYFFNVCRNWSEPMVVEIEILGEGRSLVLSFNSAQPNKVLLGASVSPDLKLTLPANPFNLVVQGAGPIRGLFYSFLFQAKINRRCGLQSQVETWRESTELLDKF